MMLGGLRVLINDHLDEWDWVQFRFPRSKARRVRKKWSRRRANFRRVYRPPVAYRVGNTLIVSSRGLRELEHRLALTPAAGCG